MTGLGLATALQVILQARKPRLELSAVSERGGVLEPGASFNVTDEDGKTWRVILARQS